MIIELLILLFVVMLSGLVWHLAHTAYKEREWKRNNPDEFNLLNRNKNGK
mgnify:FL=1